MDFDRQALWGETSKTRAWPHVEKVGKYLRDRDGRRQATLKSLFRAAHAGDARIPPSAVDFQFGEDLELHILEARLSHLVLTAKTPQERLSMLEGVLDLQQVYCDLIATPTRDHLSEYLNFITMPSLLESLERQDGFPLSEDAKRLWLRGLERLEERFPANPPGFSWIAHWGEMSLNDRKIMFEEWDFDLRDVVQAMDALEKIRPAWERLLKHGGPDIESRAQELEDSMEFRSKALMGVAFREHLPSLAMNWIMCCSKISFLRHALALDLGEDSTLDIDPFGTGVHVDTSNWRVHVWTQNGPGGAKIEVKL